MRQSKGGNVMSTTAVRFYCCPAAVCVLITTLSGCAATDSDVAQANRIGSDFGSLTLGPFYAANLIATEMYASYNQQARSDQILPRQLHTIKGRVAHLDGSPLAATLVVRVTDSFTPAPERLASYTISTTPDGTFDIPLGNHNALCVDFAAPGKQPTRKWFILAFNNVAKSLPADQAQIVFVSPYYEMNDRIAIQLPSGEPCRLIPQ
jgi:hypothetical protein